MDDLFRHPPKPTPAPAAANVQHVFVDEAGDPALFNRKKRVIVGNDGCSTYFLLGKLIVHDPDTLHHELNELRASLLAEPYFRDVPSMQPSQRKTAEKFHAKDDVPEVRREVYRYLLSRHDRFYAVVRDKRKVLADVQARNVLDPQYRYQENDLYDALTTRLFERFQGGITGEVKVCFSARGARDRTRALGTAIRRAEDAFEDGFGFRRETEVTVTGMGTAEHGALQAVDYYLWPLQRFFERRETRHARLIWPRVGEVVDLDATPGTGTYNQSRPLCPEPEEPD